MISAARVLIVEDEAVLRMTFSEFLIQERCEVHTAANYGEAIGYLDRMDLDVIITDIILGGRTGVDLLRTVRDRGLRTPVVMITGEPNVETASESVRLGAFDYLPKPVTREALRRVVRLALEHKRLGDERDHYARQMDIYRRDLEAIFNSVNDGIVTVDAEMRVRRVNSAAVRILGIDSVSYAGLPFGDLLPGRLVEAQNALQSTLARRTPVVDQRVEATIGDGDERVLMVSASPLIGEGNVFAGALLMIRDVTRLTRLEKEIEDRQQYRNIIGKSSRMQEIFALIRELAETDSTVLICGESGTGKELVASALHHASRRAAGPFLQVNCAALSESILESELFGHVKGAFTGAVRDRVGRFEAANGGTILLDEIGDVSARLQLRLLRVLQEREFERVGSSRSIKTDVRVIASTNQDLEQRIRTGEFRQDLYYRLNVVRIEIPALRQRREDLPLLVDHFCRRFNTEFKKEITGVAPETMEVFMRYPWPGNVRELENCMERAFIVCHDQVILPRHLSQEILAYDRSNSGAVPAGTSPGNGGGVDKANIVEMLDRTDWNVAKTARLLGVARNTLYQKMRALNITRPGG